jgi:hypothetical protein
MRRVALGLIALVVMGCAGTPIPPTYTQAQLQATCERTGGWWRPNDLMGGYCEYQGPQP